jgi:hypothetical protein
MSSFKRKRGLKPATTKARNRVVAGFSPRFLFLVIACAWPSQAKAQQQPEGFAIERFYPAPPGSGWLVLDDLKMTGGLGGAVSFTTDYSHDLSVISDQAFMDVGVAGTYRRYRVYLNFPMPLVVAGSNGNPSVGVSSNPDTISDPRAGFDVRFFGAPAGSLRLGAGAQLIMPSGERSDYVTDGTYRGALRFHAAGDVRNFAYSGQIGLHIRPLNESSLPAGPNGNEFLFGIGAGRKIPVHQRWEVFVGPEFFGETAVHSFFHEEKTGVEGLLTGRLERTGDSVNLRLKLGIGHGIVQHFGAPQWRLVFSAELFGHHTAGTNSADLP